MNISKIRCAWEFLTGGASGLVEYLLDLLAKALDKLSDGEKKEMDNILNFATKILSIIRAVQVLIPTKWQTAYVATITAVQTLIDSLTDRVVTKEELDKIIDDFRAAVAAWKAE